MGKEFMVFFWCALWTVFLLCIYYFFQSYTALFRAITEEGNLDAQRTQQIVLLIIMQAINQILKYVSTDLIAYRVDYYRYANKVAPKLMDVHQI